MRVVGQYKQNSMGGGHKTQRLVGKDSRVENMYMKEVGDSEYDQNTLYEIEIVKDLIKYYF